MKIFVLEEELLALFHVLWLEEVIELFLQMLHYPLESFLDLFARFLICIFDFFLEIEHFHHELTILNFRWVLNINSPDLHHIDSPPQVIQQSGLRLINIGRVLFHIVFEQLFHILIERVFIGMVLFLQFFSLDTYYLLIYMELFRATFRR